MIIFENMYILNAYNFLFQRRYWIYTNIRLDLRNNCSVIYTQNLSYYKSLQLHLLWWNYNDWIPLEHSSLKTVEPSVFHLHKRNFVKLNSIHIYCWCYICHWSGCLIGRLWELSPKATDTKAEGLKYKKKKRILITQVNSS